MKLYYFTVVPVSIVAIALIIFFGSASDGGAGQREDLTKNVVVLSLIDGQNAKLVETYHTISGTVCFSVASKHGERRINVDCIGDAEMTAVARGRIRKFVESKYGNNDILQLK